jgi:hypothetical protein
MSIRLIFAQKICRQFAQKIRSLKLLSVDYCMPLDFGIGFMIQVFPENLTWYFPSIRLS